MPFLLGLLGILTAIGIWYWRFRMAKDAASEVMDMARDVQSAARRFGFRRRTNLHPADAVDDPRLAAAGVVLAISGIDGPHTKAELDMLKTECRARFGVDEAEAQDMVAFGRWVAGQCQTPEEAARRLGRVVRTKAFDAGEELLEMIGKVTTVDGQMGEREQRAWNQVADMFGLR